MKISDLLTCVLCSFIIKKSKTIKQRILIIFKQSMATVKTESKTIISIRCTYFNT